MTPKQINQIYNTVCLPLQTDSEWYDRIKNQLHNYYIFKRITKTYLITQSMYDSLTQDEIQYTCIYLYDYFKGLPNPHSNSYLIDMEIFKSYNTNSNQPTTKSWMPRTAFKTPLTNQKETIMSNSVAFETKSYIFGTDASSMNEDQLIESIKKVEKEIENLKSVKTKSKKIESKIANLEKMLVSIVEILDK